MTEKPSPDIPGSVFSAGELADQFSMNLSAGGGKVERVKRNRIDVRLNEIYERPGKVLNLSEFSTIPTSFISSGKRPGPEHIDLLIVDGLIGVAGNGAVWLTEEKIMERRYPFIATDLLVMLPHELLVPDLIQAYRRIDLSTGFGIWIAGPSKTADIEQSLVFGAQGTLRHTVFIIN
jgi:L-lactate dehydrogenase complex protein LldG